uniref:golgin subfamily A member 6-like protein 22 isoform X2 n=1 Tax=Scatophagus argus TaxID=75038 RepID=UPI001ED85564|nr:golgin subfamily A member 6-like protein 22 isoform X2 [Scatophagus argus]
MYRPSCRSPSPFSLTDLDMWDTQSRFTAQTSAWCGMATVSGSGFLSKVSTSASGSSSSYRQNDASLRKWQSLSHLVPEGPTRAFSPSPGAQLRDSRGASSFGQAETGQWLDIKHKQLSEVTSALEQEREPDELHQFGKRRQLGEIHEKGSSNQPAERTPGSLGTTLQMSQEDFNRQERQKADKELCKLREALRDAEARAKTQEEEQKQVLQKLQTSTETQRVLLNQIEEMNQRFWHLKQNHSEVQEQLSEANNRISQACLEKAILSTQVLKLEDDIKQLKAKLMRPLSDKGRLIQEKVGLHQKAQVLDVQMKEDHQGSEERGVIQTETKSHNNKEDQETVLTKKQSKALREANEKLICELEMIKQNLNTSQSQLQEITAQKAKQITDLEAECSQLITEKEELLKTNEGQHEELTEMKEKCSQLRQCVEVLEIEKLNLQDRYLQLEEEVLEKDEKLQLQEEEYQKHDVVKVQSAEELRAVASHWTEKWQKVALRLQSTQAELEELKKNNSRTEKEYHSVLKTELEACKQELELERSRTQQLLQGYKHKGGEASVHTQDTETVTDLSQSSLLWEPPSDSHSSQNKPPQVCVQSNEVQELKQRLVERERELREKEEALENLERLREMERNEAQLKIFAMELKASETCQDDGGQANGTTTDSLRAQLEESLRRAKQLQQEKTLAVQRLQRLRQLYSVKDERLSVEGRKGKTVCPVNLDTEQQRRMVTEQLKSLFKEQERKLVGKIDERSAAAQAGSSSLQDSAPASTAVRSAVDRRSWQRGSGLMPVFEEDEEANDWPGVKERKPAEEAHTGEKVDNQNQQMSTTGAESSLKAKSETQLQATLSSQRPIQGFPPTADKSVKSPDVEEPNSSHCSDVIDLQQKRTPSPYPDGIFQAELVDICSPDEDEDEDEIEDK